MAIKPGDTVLVLGGCGFLGRALISELHQRGYVLRVVTRRPDRHRDLLVFPRLTVLAGNVHDDQALAQFARGCHAIVNLIGVFAERSPQEFRQVHEDLPMRIGRVAGGRAILHASAIGASLNAASACLRSKAAGEARLREVAPQAIIVRPHVLYGPRDRFVCRFARWLRWSPFGFPVPFPDADLYPAHVADMAAGLGRALALVRAAGQTYELCGPEAVPLRHAVEAISQATGLRVSARPLSLLTSRRLAQFGARFPTWFFAADPWWALRDAGPCGREALGFAALETEPRPFGTALRDLLPRVSPAR